MSSSDAKLFLIIFPLWAFYMEFILGVAFLFYEVVCWGLIAAALMVIG